MKKGKEIGKGDREMNLYMSFSCLAARKDPTISWGNPKKMEMPMPSHASLLHCNIMELVVLVLTGPSPNLKLHRIMSVHLPCLSPNWS